MLAFRFAHLLKESNTFNHIIQTLKGILCQQTWKSSQMTCMRCSKPALQKQRGTKCFMRSGKTLRHYGAFRRHFGRLDSGLMISKIFQHMCVCHYQITQYFLQFRIFTSVHQRIIMHTRRRMKTDRTSIAIPAFDWHSCFTLFMRTGCGLLCCHTLSQGCECVGRISSVMVTSCFCPRGTFSQ